MRVYIGKQKENCSIFTPDDIVRKMLDLLDYKANLYGKKILENSCGDGNFLVEIVKRYILDGKKQGLSDKTIKIGLNKDIVGFELDEAQFKTCMERLDKSAKEFGLRNVKWDIRNEDALKADFLYAVGNPPYITYSALKSDNRKYIKENFSVCSEGKPDYYYAFIESAIEHLSVNGRFAYLVPSNFFKTKFAKKLRKYLLPMLTDIYDYKAKKLFQDILTSSAIVMCKKNNTSSEMQYHDLTGNTSTSVSKTALSDRWVFTIDGERSIGKTFRFGDYFSASSSIATLCNDVFIINQGNKDVLQDLESDILRDAVSPKSLANKKKEHIIFPYYYDDKNALKHYTDKEFQQRFPQTTKHLKANKQKLDERDSDKSALWYEYGRSQALSHLNQPKLLMSTLITGKPKVYLLSKDAIPYSGIYIVPISTEDKDEKVKIDLHTAKSILESKDFLLYAQRVGIYANGTSIRIAISDINNFTFSSKLLSKAKSGGADHGKNKL